MSLDLIPGEKVLAYDVVRVKKPSRARKNALDWEIPDRPEGGWIGDLIIEHGNVDHSTYPLTVRVMFSPVIRKDLIPPSEEDSRHLEWDEPMDLLDRDKNIRSIQHEDRILIEDGTNGVLRVPLYLIDGSRQGRMFDFSAPLYSCRIEISDGRGKILHRSLLVELYSTGAAYNSGPEAWVTQEAEADRLLRELGGITESSTIKELPREVAPYMEVGSLWLSRDIWREKKLSRLFVRRLLLSGLWIYGRDDTVQQIAEEVGLDHPQAILLSGVMSPDGLTLQMQRRNRRRRGQSSRLLGDVDYGYCRDEDPAFLENRSRLFSDLSGSYARWTLSVYILFGLIAAVGLPVAFVRLRGPRRLLLWWLLPVMAVVVGTGGWALGLALLDREQRIDVTEYRFTYGDWPETYCQSVARALRFQDGDFGWTLPEGAIVLPRQRQMFRNEAWRSTLTRRGKEDSYSLLDASRGVVLKSEIGYFTNAICPLRIVREEQQLLTTSRDLRKVAVRASGRWYVIGDMAAGQTVDPTSGSRTNELHGLPARIQELFGTDVRVSMDSHSHSGSGVKRKIVKDEQVDVFTNCWLVLALDEKEWPLLQPDPEGGVSNGRVVWFAQMPLRSVESRELEEDVP